MLARAVGEPSRSSLSPCCCWRCGQPEALDAARGFAVAAAAGSLVAVLAGLLASALVWRALLARSARCWTCARRYTSPSRQPAREVRPRQRRRLRRPDGARPGARHPRSPVGTASLLFMGVLVAPGLLAATVALPLTSPAALRSYARVLLDLPLGTSPSGAWLTGS